MAQGIISTGNLSLDNFDMKSVLNLNYKEPNEVLNEISKVYHFKADETDKSGLHLVYDKTKPTYVVFLDRKPFLVDAQEGIDCIAIDTFTEEENGKTITYYCKGWRDRTIENPTDQDYIPNHHTFYPQHSIALIPDYEVQYHVLFCRPNGGTMDSTEIQSNEFGEVTLPSITHNGTQFANGTVYYTFDGWYDSENGGLKIGNPGDTFEIQDSMIVWAHWNQIHHTVTLSGGIGSDIPHTYTTNEQGEVTLPINPQREDYSFLGWYDESEGGNLVTYGGTYFVAEDQTLYAHWSYSPENYTITFNSAGGTEVPSRTVEIGSAIGELPTTTKNGFTFRRWECEGVEITSDFVPSSNCMLIAVWEANLTIPEIQTVSSDGTITWTAANGATGYTVKKYESGRWYSVDVSGSTTSYKFENFSNNVTQVEVAATDGINDTSSSQELTWHTITVDCNGGSYNGHILFYRYRLHGETVGILTDEPPERENYLFIGWKIDNTLSSANIEVTSDCTAIASWRINLATPTITTVRSDGYVEWTPISGASNYAVTRFRNGNAIATNQVSDSVYYFPNQGLNPYYDQIGVTAITTDDDGLNQSSTGYYNLNWIIITLDANGGSVNSSTVNRLNGEAIGTLPTPTRPYYDFTNWTINGNSVTSSYVPTANCTAVAHWQAVLQAPTNIQVSSDGVISWDAANGAVQYAAHKYVDGLGWQRGTKTSSTTYTYNSFGPSITKVKVTAYDSENREVDSEAVNLNWIEISFNADGGTVSPSSIYRFAGEQIGTLPTPTKNYFSFRCWTIGSQIISSSYVVSTAKEALAHWELAMSAPTGVSTTSGGRVSWNAVDGASYYKIGRKNSSGVYTWKTTTTTDTYDTFGTFDSTNASAVKVRAYLDASNYTESAEYIVPWITITYNANGGTAERSSDVRHYGTNIALPSATHANQDSTSYTLRKYNYTLDGWYRGSNNVGNAGTQYTVPSSSTELTAKWNYSVYLPSPSSVSATNGQKTVSFSMMNPENKTIYYNMFKYTKSSNAVNHTSEFTSTTNGTISSNFGSGSGIDYVLIVAQCYDSETGEYVASNSGWLLASGGTSGTPSMTAAECVALVKKS